MTTINTHTHTHAVHTHAVHTEYIVDCISLVASVSKTCRPEMVSYSSQLTDKIIVNCHYSHYVYCCCYNYTIKVNFVAFHTHLWRQRLSIKSIIV